MAGTAGTHKGKKKGDPCSEPGVLTLVLPLAPPPLCSQPPTQAAGGWRHGEPGIEPHRPGLAEGAEAHPRELQPGPICPSPLPSTLPVHGDSSGPHTSFWDSDKCALARHPTPSLPWALLAPPQVPKMRLQGPLARALFPLLLLVISAPSPRTQVERM